MRGPGFNSLKPRKVGGRSTSPEGRAVLHQATDKSFVRGPRKDSQSATGFGGEVGNVAFPGKLERKDFFQRIVEKVDGGVSRRSFRRDIVRVRDLSGLKNMFHVLDQLAILSRCVGSEEAAACRPEG